MSRLISPKNMLNTWGKQIDPSNPAPLEPQRSDLFVLDFGKTPATIANLLNVDGVTVQATKEIPTQYIRSINLPEVKVRAEAFRRDSIAYNMPSWDEPIEAIKIAFVLDTHDGEDESDVLEFLDRWIALVRAGRGSRFQGYNAPNKQGYVTLDANFGVTYAFDIYVRLLRGVSATDIFTTLSMTAHIEWALRQAWCAGYKLSDFTYENSSLTLVDATFYAEAVERKKILEVSGAPTLSNLG
jgi:hypothetical protein